MRLPTAVLAATLLCTALPVKAQTAGPVPDQLTLDDAVAIARQHNPTFLQTRNDLQVADWDVRQAWGQLLPSATASSSVSWQGAGEQRFGSLTLGDLGFGGQPSYYFSNYNLGLNWNLSWSSVLAPREAKTRREAVLATVDQGSTQLVARVTNAYLEVLRQREALTLARQQLENTRYNLRLAQAQLEVGQATPIDVGQAEVQVGRSEVGVLQAENALETARLRLLQELGVELDQEFEPATTFSLTEPTWTLEELYEQAQTRNPGLRAARRSKDAADVRVSQARGAYYPSLSVSTGLSGFTREASSVDAQVAQAQAQVASRVASCVQTNELYARLADPLPLEDCTRFAFTDEQRNAIVSQNDQFPFDFQGSPPSVSLTVSVPLFQGLTRQRSLEAAQVEQDDRAHQLRADELALRADLRVELATVRTAYQSALLEERNRDLAQQQLQLARDRYQLGVITFVELVDAQTVLAQAERDRIAAVFIYHDAVTRLESLVGVPLRI